jgi:hypothetical protein
VAFLPFRCCQPFPALRVRNKCVPCALEAPREFAFVNPRPVVSHHDDRRISTSHPVGAVYRSNIDMEAPLKALDGSVSL